jgi:hypothetical protein
VADLELNLQEIGKLDEFKKEFLSKTGKEWSLGRNQFSFLQDKIVSILVSTGVMSEGAARDLFKATKAEFEITKEQFAQRVKEYLNRKGKNHRILFMVDEMGQYIGQDTGLMLDLQTITEELGKTCQGKAWVIVTSQEDIDSITKNMAERSNDFSKIQGRFDTKLPLISSDVAEVIRKRILEKTDAAKQALSVMYQQNETALKNLVIFKDTAEMKTFTDGGGFASDYPFIPYQFDQLGRVLTAIRNNGASGKHLAQGERSMLALFKESAVRIDKKETGPLAPFNYFYDALDKFLDTDIAGVVQGALRNDKINPARSPECFNVDVLKTLFLIKYVKEIPSNIENITSLMVSSMDEKRLILKQRIEEALQKLIAETLVAKKGENYIFLTNEEQAINKEIERQNVGISDVRRELGSLIFENSIGEARYKYPDFNGRYTFPYTQKIDEYQVSNYQHPVTVQILTPYSGVAHDDISLHLHSSQIPGVVIFLPERTDYLDEIRGYLQIESYLKTGVTLNFQKAETIKSQKREENGQKRENARLILVDALEEARFFVHGNEIPSAGGDFRNRVRSALQTSIKMVYHKLSYIDTPMAPEHIRNLFVSDQLIAGKGNENADALEDMRLFIQDNFGKHQRTSMNTLQERFMKPPYGFIEYDVEWLCAKLFRKGDILIFVNGQQISIQDKSADELVNYFTKKQYVNTLAADIRQKANDVQLRTLREVVKELYNDSAQNDDEDALLIKFKTETDSRLRELESFSSEYRFFMGKPGLPGETAVQGGLVLLRKLNAEISRPMTFFDELKNNKDALLDFADDYRNIKGFFTGPQKEIFKTAVAAAASFEDNKNFISPALIPGIAQAIKSILVKDEPYSDIPKLPELTQKYRDALAEEYKSKQIPILEKLEKAKTEVLSRAADKASEGSFLEDIICRLDDLDAKIKDSTEPYLLPSYSSEIDNIRTIALEGIRRRNETAQESESASGTVPPKIRKVERVSFKTIFDNREWHITSEADIEDLVSKIRRELALRLDNDTTIEVEF